METNDSTPNALSFNFKLLFNSAKLRARQKERLARRNAVEESRPGGVIPEPESHPQCPGNDKGGDQVTEVVQDVRDKSPVIDLEDHKVTQPSDPPKSKGDSALRLGRPSKHKMSSHSDLAINPLGHSSSDVLFPSHHYQGTSHTISLPANNLLPVLGLCAPNAKQLESSQKNLSKSNSRQSRSAARPEFPFSLAPCAGTSVETDLKGQESDRDKQKLQDASAEFSQHCLRSDMPDNRLPFNPVLSLDPYSDDIHINILNSYRAFVSMVALFFFCSILYLPHKEKFLTI